MGRTAAGSPAAWLRLWTETLVLAFLTGRPLPAVPPPLRRDWDRCDARARECTLATIAEQAVGARAAALRGSYPVECLTAAVARVAASLLDRRRAPGRAGLVWVIPQLRWAHEADRVGWRRRDGPPGGDLAPPLDFMLAGLRDWPGIGAAERLRMLLRHPLSPRLELNRQLAAVALLGDGWERGGCTRLAADLAQVVPAAGPAERLRDAAAIMQCADGFGGWWLETVLSWPASG